MKILHLIHKQQNRGAETFACQLASHQKRMGHKVFMVAVYPGNSILPWGDEIICIEGSQKKRIIDYKAWKNLNNLLQKLKPDILQANSGDTLKYAVFSKKLFRWNIPIIFRNASEVGQYLNTAFQKKFNNILYQNVDAVASVSQTSKVDLISYFSYLEKKTRVIPVGLEKRSDIIPAVFDKEANYNIVHVGGFSFEKNHAALIKIFRKVVNQNISAHLHLIGDGPLRATIENMVEQMNLDQNISFYGFVNNPLDYIKAGDIFVLPSKIEGLPGVLLEAMFCKIPVVAYNVGGISEIVNSETGTLVEKENENKFTAAILENLKHPSTFKIMNAYKMVTENYMNEKLAEDFLRFYEKVLK